MKSLACQLLQHGRAGTAAALQSSCGSLPLSCMQGPGAVPLQALDSPAADTHAQGRAAEATSDLAAAAAKFGVAVDVLAVGASAVNAPLLGMLTRQSGGSLTLHAGEHARLLLLGIPGSACVWQASGAQPLASACS